MIPSIQASHNLAWSHGEYVLTSSFFEALPEAYPQIGGQELEGAMLISLIPAKGFMPAHSVPHVPGQLDVSSG